MDKNKYLIIYLWYVLRVGWDIFMDVTFLFYLCIGIRKKKLLSWKLFFKSNNLNKLMPD